jgi:hypothetical protein
MSDTPAQRSEIDLDEFDELSHVDQLRALERFAKERADATGRYRKLVEHLRLRSLSMDVEDREIYTTALAHIPVDELTHFDVTTLAGTHREPIRHAESFFRKIVERRRKKQLGLVPEKYIGLDKVRDQVLADMFGLTMPEVYHTGTLLDIPGDLRTNILAKPTNSRDSRGAYCIFTPADIFSIEHSRSLRSWDEMLDDVAAGLGPDAANQAVWQVQQLILEAEGQAARDFKFHTFYGEIGLILESKRHPTKQYAYFDEDGTLADVGRTHYPRFGDDDKTVFDKGGVTEEMLDRIRWLSRQLPVPYMRMDFVYTPEALFFVEFCSAPGSSHTWSDERDRSFGERYLRAELRLIQDLLAGKPFDLWHEYQRNIAPREAALFPPESSQTDLAVFDSMETEQRVSVVDRLAARRQAAIDDYRELAEHLRSSARPGSDEADLYVHAASRLSIAELTHPDLTTMARDLRVPIAQADSFFRKIVERRRKKQLGPVPEKYLGLRPEHDRLFARIAGEETVQPDAGGGEEEAGGQPIASELRFFCFYGEVALILELQRLPARRYAYFDPDFSPASVGREHGRQFDDLTDTVIGQGRIGQSHLATVSALSSKIPTPFMRIDFRWGERHLEFTTFSSAPGSSHTFNETWDRRLGEAYLDAEMRLIDDLLSGHQFPELQRFLDEIETG